MTISRLNYVTHYIKQKDGTVVEARDFTSFISEEQYYQAQGILSIKVGSQIENNWLAD